ncbi:MAG TPA: ABC transporter substrate-binding protein [Acetobacteraceae bacterium]|nr:ABC transporter substrate-binding protein [Acetobacteraceae bacterium]
MKLTRRASLLAALLPLAAHAQNTEAAAPIQALCQALTQVARAGRTTPFMQRYNMLAPAIDGAIDLPGILQLAVGAARWRALPPNEQTALLDVFRKFTVASYVSNFTNGERFEVLPESRTLGSDQVVATRVVPTNDTPTRLDYVMRRTQAGWRAVDVLLDGSISQVAVYRSDWRASLASGAGPLIANLQAKVASLSGGALR